MRRALPAFLAACCPLLMMAPGASASSARSFLEQAIHYNTAEIRLGQLAETRGSSEGVRSFGRTLETDHSRINAQAIVLAKDMDIPVPDDTQGPGHKEYDKLSAMSGPEFDSAFVDAMILDQRRDMDAYQDEANVMNKSPLAKYAATSLPLLQHHLEMAESLEKQASR
jgi:putative membrane protein